MKKNFYIVFQLVILKFIFLSSFIWAQNENTITIIGRELIGRVENGEIIREVIGDVVLTQGNVVITCDRAIQYIERNDAKLMGNVIVRQDTLTIKTDEGFYFGNSRRAYSNKGVILDDKKVILTARIGEYFFNEQYADFEENVKLVDAASTLTSERLIYYRRLDKAVAIDNVKIIDAENEITADSLIHYRNEKMTYGFDNIKIKNFRNNTWIFGDRITDDRNKNYSLIDLNPLLVQIDSVKTKVGDSIIVTIDSLIIKSNKMESFRDTTNRFIATDSVLIVRGNFASRNDYTIYFRDKDKIITNIKDGNSEPPILWFENSQLSGDSITIFLKESKIDEIFINRNALLVSENILFPKRFDQISGSRIVLRFYDGKLSATEVFENVLSIYFLYEGPDPNGAIKASAKDAIIEILDGRVDKVKLYGNPNSEFFPEILVRNKEKEFTLPRFQYFGSRPTREYLIQINKKEKNIIE